MRNSKIQPLRRRLIPIYWIDSTKTHDCGWGCKWKMKIFKTDLCFSAVFRTSICSLTNYLQISTAHSSVRDCTNALRDCTFVQYYTLKITPGPLISSGYLHIIRLYQLIVSQHNAISLARLLCSSKYALVGFPCPIIVEWSDAFCLLNRVSACCVTVRNYQSTILHFRPSALPRTRIRTLSELVFHIWRNCFFQRDIESRFAPRYRRVIGRIIYVGAHPISSFRNFLVSLIILLFVLRHVRSGARVMRNWIGQDSF